MISASRFGTDGIPITILTLTVVVVKAPLIGKPAPEARAEAVDVRWIFRTVGTIVAYARITGRQKLNDSPFSKNREAGGVPALLLCSESDNRLRFSPTGELEHA